MCANRQFSSRRTVILVIVVLPVLLLSMVPRGYMPALTAFGPGLVWCGGQGPTVVPIAPGHQGHGDPPSAAHMDRHRIAAEPVGPITDPAGAARDLCLWSLHMHARGDLAPPPDAAIRGVRRVPGAAPAPVRRYAQVAKLSRTARAPPAFA